MDLSKSGQTPKTGGFPVNSCYQFWWLVGAAICGQTQIHARYEVLPEFSRWARCHLRPLYAHRSKHMIYLLIVYMCFKKHLFFNMSIFLWIFSHICKCTWIYYCAWFACFGLFDMCFSIYYIYIYIYKFQPSNQFDNLLKPNSQGSCLLLIKNIPALVPA